MRKAFCDICEKELNEENRKFYLEITNLNKTDDRYSCVDVGKDICGECKEKIGKMFIH